MGTCGRNIETDINEALCDTKLWLVISILIIVKLTLTKLMKICKRSETVNQSQ